MLFFSICFCVQMSATDQMAAQDAETISRQDMQLFRWLVLSFLLIE